MDAVDIDGCGHITNYILCGTVYMECITSVDKSREMGNFIQTLKRPTSKEGEKLVQELNYNLVKICLEHTIMKMSIYGCYGHSDGDKHKYFLDLRRHTLEDENE